VKQHIIHMLKDRVKKYGDREVFRFMNKNEQEYRSLNWNELNNEIDSVSKALLRLGFGYNSKIGIFSNNRHEWSIADYGIMEIRGVVVPFFGTATKEQVKYIVDETKMELLFVGNKEQMEKARWVLDQTKSLSHIIVFDDDIQIQDQRFMTWAAFKELAGKEEDDKLIRVFNEAQPDDLATIIYTSGTTGEPKGVMLGHDNFMYAFSIHDERLDITDEDISMCFLPLSHIFERTWSFYVLFKGAVNVFLDNPREVIDVLPVIKPTLMCTVSRFFEKTHEGIMAEYEKWPSTKKNIFDWSIGIGHKYSDYKSRSANIPLFLQIKRSIADKLVLKKLREIFGGNIRMIPCSGAAIRPELLKFFHATGLFVNFGYGATETTATVSCYKSDVYNFNSCGTIMPSVEVKLGSENEILVKGKTVFRGYYNKPEETSKVLVDGWYKTGDEGQFAEDGNLVMKDRIKDLFKTSVGKYVSPQKIELLLGQDPYIEQIITIGDNKKYVTALIVPTLASIKAHAKEIRLKHTSDKHLVSMAEIKDLMQKRIDQLQKELASFERIVKFELLHEPFTIENNAMTSTLKFRRNIIINKYNELIETMY
jgi:long-chain acyl-CoA synthetase